MSFDERFDSLKGKHQTLEQEIELEEKRPHPDDIHLHELKKSSFIKPVSRLDEGSYMIDVWSIDQPGRKYLSHYGLL